LALYFKIIGEGARAGQKTYSFIMCLKKNDSKVMLLAFTGWSQLKDRAERDLFSLNHNEVTINGQCNEMEEKKDKEA